MNYDDEWMEEGDDLAMAVPAEVPPNMRLTVEVGLTEYTPNGLLGLIASAMVKEVGGQDRWKARFRGLLAKEGIEKLRGLIDAEAALLFEGHREGLRDAIRKGFDAFFVQKVNSRGEPAAADTFSQREAKDTRLDFLVRQFAAATVEAAWREMEQEMKARWTADIKAVITDLMAARVEKALPAPKIGERG